jgi:lysophospholipase L1-like esterase
VEVDTFNDLIRSVARDTQVPLIDMDRLMSGQLEQFGDATHFSADGEELFAEFLARDLTLLNVLAP